MDRGRIAKPAALFGALALGLIGLIGLVSCPNPVDEALLRLVEDDLPPDLTIVSPVGNSLYGATVQVSGTLRDSAFAVGDDQGRLKSLDFGVPSDPQLSQRVDFDASGGWTLSRPDPSFTYDAGTGQFSFEFSTVGLAGGPKVLAFNAADFNDNTSERALTLLEDPSGPYVNLLVPTNLSNYDITVNLQGTVTNGLSDPATNDVRLVRWECLQDLARNGSWDTQSGSAGNLSYDPGNGAFTGWFDTIGLAGTIGIRLYAEDYGGHRTEISVQLLDNRPGPEILIETWPAAYSSTVTTTVTVTGKVNHKDIDWTQFTFLAYGSPSGSTGGVVTNHQPWYYPPLVPTDYDTFSFSFNPKNAGIAGLMTVKVKAKDSSGKRESEQSVTVSDDPVRPTILPPILPGALAGDNSRLDITFSEAVYTSSNGTGALLPGDFALSFTRNGGSATGAAISGVLMTAPDTASLALSIAGTPSGVETIVVTPAGNYSIYDLLGNAMLSTQTTGAVPLNDRLAPIISSASMAGDNDLDITFSEAVYTSTGGGELTAADFTINFAANGGTATGASISSVLMSADKKSAHLDLTINGTPSGVETVTVTPRDGAAIYDFAGNPMLAAQSTGAVTLHDRLAPTIASASVASDNAYLQVSFSEGVYTNGDGTGNLQAADFDLTFRRNSGTATSATLAGVTRVSSSTYRLNLNISGTPDGNETVEATPASASAIYDSSGNAMAGTETTGVQNLNAP